MAHNCDTATWTFVCAGKIQASQLAALHIAEWARCRDGRSNAMEVAILYEGDSLSR